ncbi:MAG: beta-ketoacyl synthase N-terminal-like domain-containing protein, partial [Sediminispirochaetaceae bacterium]
MDKKRVVITGMGTVNPLGNSVDATWKALMRGESGITEISRFDPSNIASRIAGEIKDFDYTVYFDGDMRKKAKRMDLFCHYAAAAAAEATEQARLKEISR